MIVFLSLILKATKMINRLIRIINKLNGTSSPYKNGKYEDDKEENHVESEWEKNKIQVSQKVIYSAWSINNFNTRCQSSIIC